MPNVNILDLEKDNENYSRSKETLAQKRAVLAQPNNKM